MTLITGSVFYHPKENATSWNQRTVLEPQLNTPFKTKTLLEAISSNPKLSFDTEATTKINENEEKNTFKPKAEINTESLTPKISKIIKEKNQTLARETSVPFYSQFTDITSPSRQKIGCGVASLAMLIELYQPDEKVSVDDLFEDGLKAGAYLDNAGWIHAGLINLSHKYGLDGQSYDLAGKSSDLAFNKLKTVLDDGPVMASVHYTFEPTNPIPHLVVINSVSDDGNTVFYNDPAETSGNNSISKEKFIKAWKKRYIEIRPIT